MHAAGWHQRPPPMMCMTAPSRLSAAAPELEAQGRTSVCCLSRIHCAAAQAEAGASYLNFLSGLPHPSLVPPPRRRPRLPSQEPAGEDRKTLVLDMDPTLICSGPCDPEPLVEVRRSAACSGRPSTTCPGVT